MLYNRLYEEYADDLYNPDLKFRFLEENYPNRPETQLTIIYNFIKAARVEKIYDKDLCTFNTEEINELVESLGYTTENTIRAALSYFSTYVNWCMLHSMRGDYETGINDFEIFINTQDLSKFTSRIKNKNRYITKEEMGYALEALNNPIDQAILLGIYEGIFGEELYELRTLKKEGSINFETNQVTLVNLDGSKRTKTISQELADIFQDAINQQVYLVANGEETKVKNKVRALAKSEYIIRPISKGTNSHEMMEYSAIVGRFITIKKYAGLEYVTPQSLFDSGAINRVVELTKEKGLDKPTDEIFKILQQPDEYNLSHNELYNFKKKYKLATELKNFF